LYAIQDIWNLRRLIFATGASQGIIILLGGTNRTDKEKAKGF
jgi:hypothetical protein